MFKTSNLQKLQRYKSLIKYSRTTRPAVSYVPLCSLNPSIPLHIGKIRSASTAATSCNYQTLKEEYPIYNNYQDDKHWFSYQRQQNDSDLQNKLKHLEKLWLNNLINTSKNTAKLGINDRNILTEQKYDNSKDNQNKENIEKNSDEDKNNEIEKNINDNVPEKNKTNNNNESTSEGNSKSSSNSGNHNNGSSSDNGSPYDNNSNSPVFNNNPKLYPQMLALPISRRPLFPGFYKAVVITDERVMNVIKEMLKRQQPYIGAFMLKDSELDVDVIKNIEDVYETGVFAQVTSAFPSKDEKTGKETLTALLYPHRRIKISELIPPKEEPEKSTEVVSTTSNDPLADLLPIEMQPLNNSLHNISTAANLNKDTNKTNMNNDLEVATKQDFLHFVEQQELVDEDNENVSQQKDGASTSSQEGPTDFLNNYNVSIVNVVNLEDEPFDRKSPVINALTSEILKVFKEISQLNTMFREQIATFSASIQSATTNIFEEPARLADFAAAVSAGEEIELQEVLESLNIEQRLERSLLVLKRELMNAELQNKISKDVETKIQKRQREYYLMEQLKGIKRELGIDDGRDKLIDSFKKRVEKLVLPEQVQKIFDEELTKLSTLETSMSEFGVIRNYLDWITSLPWGINSVEQYSISKARKILDEDHYGLKDVKDRILEFIAVGKLLGKVDGKILCFVGPPGVGKTSIGKSIARSLSREFYRFSVGGLTDVAEIKGHRRTYIGALPGRIIQAMKKCQTQNPLILIDEIDKIGHAGIHGDPSAALLEVLDPEQNNSFLDNYLDIPMDLSKVLFVCTANTLDTIPRPLLDRMEVIELTGYVAEEKVKIVQQYLSPNSKKSAGLEKSNVNITEDAIISLLKHYCRESGVRNLKKHIDKIYRKASLNVVKQLSIEDEDSLKSEENKDKEVSTKLEEKELNENKTGELKREKSKAKEVQPMKIPDTIKLEINSENLKDYVGPVVYTTDRLYETTPPGVVMGLAWTNMGGCSLYVESVLEQPLKTSHSPHLQRTGNLGDVMKESSTLAYSFAKMYVAKKFPENRFFEKAAIHLHCPEGAIPKDGPSAGVTMASSFLSLALDYSISPTVAMTGELTLTGKVLRIGGLREKTVAAKRSGAKTIIFPKDNLSDWSELPDNVREGLEPVPADWYDDIFDKIFENISIEQGNTTWKKDFEEIEKEKLIENSKEKSN
ncbi:hypothetical protein TBLA_0A08760 [Henningerozyma blattae CBS 6284]|uniref:Lon protease homolog, mitochondrial n=1 Tax=Henningerozyma blattae (strain ATCC 34711 / CBS 6284 / DSM 70876 / NBRC 10599 / NRRL Y-10934 / UCD 77-7) TaxID=1071380 RepID=I2GX13_HENB6|nr:hypothetical protein TBLA_0A08760 [Tetrapisispora blattae CBS 6284]CCH58665.1 hypothetical protein TBLA_0A08760 [Tetrapisispora blattae CBS 6284]